MAVVHRQLWRDGRTVSATIRTNVASDVTAMPTNPYHPPATVGCDRLEIDVASGAHDRAARTAPI
jgi:hypothetical protein